MVRIVLWWPPTTAEVEDIAASQKLSACAVPDVAGDTCDMLHSMSCDTALCHVTQFFGRHNTDKANAAGKSV